MVDEVEGTVAGQQERVALAGRVRQRLQGLGQGGHQAAYPEQTVQGRHGPVDRQVVEETVDGADPEGVAGRVDQEDQAVVPRAGEGCSVRSRR
ncbi:hypothetical protein GCM10011428_10800 [Streptomyces violaceus]